MFYRENGTRIPAKIARNPGTPMHFGQRTERFFVEGDQYEAAEWSDVTLPPEADPRAEFESFDKIPRKRGATVTIVVVGACLLIGIVAGAMAALGTEHTVNASARAFIATVAHGGKGRQALGRPSPSAAIAAATTLVPSAPSRVPSGNEAATLVARGANLAAAPAENSTVSKTDSGVPKLAGAHAGHALSRRSSHSAGAFARHPKTIRPLHDYVWSPAANAMIRSTQPEPADRANTAPVDTEDPVPL